MPTDDSIPMLALVYINITEYPLSASAIGESSELTPVGAFLSAEPIATSTEEEHRLTSHTGPVLALALDDASQRLYSSSMDCSVRVWDLEAMQCVHVIKAHNKPVTQLRLVGSRLYTAAGGMIRVYNTDTFKCIDKIKTSFYSGGIRSMLVGISWFPYLFGGTRQWP